MDVDGPSPLPVRGEEEDEDHTMELETDLHSLLHGSFVHAATAGGAGCGSLDLSTGTGTSSGTGSGNPLGGRDSSRSSRQSGASSVPSLGTMTGLPAATAATAATATATAVLRPHAPLDLSIASADPTVTVQLEGGLKDLMDLCADDEAAEAGAAPVLSPWQGEMSMISQGGAEDGDAARRAAEGDLGPLLATAASPQERALEARQAALDQSTCSTRSARSLGSRASSHGSVLLQQKPQAVAVAAGSGTGAVAAAAAKIRTSDVHYLTLVDGAAGDRDLSLDGPGLTALGLRAKTAPRPARHSVAAPGAGAEATSMMQRLRALNAGARLNALDQCSASLATGGKGVASMGKHRHSVAMSTRGGRPIDHRARPSLAPAASVAWHVAAAPATDAAAATMPAPARLPGPVTAPSAVAAAAVAEPTALAPALEPASEAVAVTAEAARPAAELLDLFACVSLDEPFYQVRNTPHRALTLTCPSPVRALLPGARRLHSGGRHGRRAVVRRALAGGAPLSSLYLAHIVPYLASI